MSRVVGSYLNGVGIGISLGVLGSISSEYTQAAILGLSLALIISGYLIEKKSREMIHND